MIELPYFENKLPLLTYAQRNVAGNFRKSKIGYWGKGVNMYFLTEIGEVGVYLLDCEPNHEMWCNHIDMLESGQNTMPLTDPKGNSVVVQGVLGRFSLIYGEKAVHKVQYKYQDDRIRLSLKEDFGGRTYKHTNLVDSIGLVGSRNMGLKSSIELRCMYTFAVPQTQTACWIVYDPMWKSSSAFERHAYSFRLNNKVDRFKTKNMTQAQYLKRLMEIEQEHYIKSTMK